MPLLNQKTQSNMPEKRPATIRGRVPTKTEINFALVGIKRIRWWLLVPAVLVIAVAVAAFAKFLVLDKLAAVSNAQAEAAQVRSELNDSLARIEAYGELNEVYAHDT